MDHQTHHPDGTPRTPAERMERAARIRAIEANREAAKRWNVAAGTGRVAYLQPGRRT